MAGESSVSYLCRETSRFVPGDKDRSLGGGFSLNRTIASAVQSQPRGTDTEGRTTLTVWDAVSWPFSLPAP